MTTNFKNELNQKGNLVQLNLKNTTNKNEKDVKEIEEKEDSKEEESIEKIIIDDILKLESHKFSEKEKEEMLTNTNDFIESNLLKFVKYIKVLENHIKSCESAIEDARSNKKVAEKRVENIKKRLQNHIIRNKLTVIGEFKITKKTSESVNIYAEDMIPAEFLKQKTTFTPDKEKIKKYLKSQEKVDEKTGEVLYGEIEGANIIQKININFK